MGDGYLNLDGSSGNYASSPDSAALSITGDIDIRVLAAATDWTPAAAMHLLNKTNVSGSYGLTLNTSGTLRLSWQTAAGGFPQKTSTAANTITDGAAKWIRATLDADNGAAGYDVKFYTSDDGSTWTQLGTTVTTATPTDIKNTTDQLEIGSQNNGTVSRFIGKIYRAQIRSNIADDGTGIVFDADFSNKSTGTRSFTESSSNAAIVTINGTAAIVAPTASGGGSANLSGNITQ